MLALRHIGAAALAVAFVLATVAIDSAEARRGGGGGGGMRGGGGFSGGGGMRGGSIGGGGFAGRAHPSHPIAGPGVGRPGWGNTPGTRPPNWAGRPGYGYGYRPGYGWGAAAAGAAVVGAGLAYGAYDPYYNDYGYYDEGAYAPQPVVEQGDPIAECARRFKTYDPASQTYIVRKGVRASCP